RHDLLARVGGDEFAILFEHCNESQARQNVEKLRELVADYRFLWNEGAFHVGLSAGLVEINANSPSAEELLREADAACYEAKRHGRNQVRSYQPGAIALTHQSGEIEYVNELREALRENRLQLHFQHIRALRSDVPDNIEILVRLQRTDGRLLAPGQILPAAERFGLARELDLWVVRQTLTYLAAHPGLHKRLGYVAINLSGLSLSEELADEVISLLDDQGLSGRRLCFEITETAAIANLSQAQHFMARLQDHQVRFALDDFGSGLSSYGYLKTLPVDVLKIDGQFVRDMLEDRSDRAIVRSIAELGQALGRPTVAEFVEQEAMIEVLREIGVDYAQGHAIARPAPLSDFEHRSAPDAADIQF
ncbi:MAG: EAL domain-containing protein, partial [Gammaproteobacteria bacterium]